MQTAMAERRAWVIDQRLADLVGCSIRVRAEQFTPRRWNGESHSIDLQKLTLPDGTEVDHDPIYVEGVLKEFIRRVAVVWLELDSPPLYGTAEGRVSFRGSPAIILRGPGTVQLHTSHFIEKLPVDANGYWHHLSSPDSQLQLPFED